MDLFFFFCFRIFALGFFGGTYVKVKLKTLNWIELVQRIIRFSSRIRLS